MGTGIRYYGLLDTKEELETKLWIASHNANDYLGRLNLSPYNTSESLVFKDKLMTLERNLMDMLVQKNMSFKKTGDAPEKMNTIQKETRKSTKTNEITPKKKGFWRRVLHFLGIRLSKDTPTKESNLHYESTRTRFTKHQEDHHPENVGRIQEKEREYNERKEEFRDLRRYAQDFEKELTSYQRDIKILNQVTLKLIDECEQEITEELQRHSEAFAVFKMETREQRIAMDNGYDLGLWHLKYGTNTTSG